MKKTILLIALCACLLAATSCKQEDTPAFTEGNNNVHVSIPSGAYPDSTTAADNNAEVVLPTLPQADATQQATEPATQEPTLPAPEAKAEYRNEYTSGGEPSLLYEVVHSGGTAVYTGVYSRYVYSAGALTTLEKWSKSPTGDALISTVNYTYDGRGNLTRTDERIPDTQGNLYTYCLTEYVNNTDGDVAMKSISYLNADGTAKQQTVYGYTYDSYGRQTLCTVTEDGSFVSSTETVYVSENGRITEMTETATKYPGTPYEQKNVLTTVFDANGNVLSVSEDDTGIHYTTTYQYDSEGREVGSRTELSDGTASEYTTSHYEDLGGGCVKITKRLYAADGTLSSTVVSCLDACGNEYIPEL